jgi:glycerol-3-phosphate dehydrogenase
MNRAAGLQQLKEIPQWDIVIVGGGATGLGCAVDAASRGYKTLLLEKYDFAKGTSSRATKLVHGGVRYLAQGNIRLVREALHERGRLLKNAPHLCNAIPFILPFYSIWQRWYYGIGLTLYEWLSGKWGLGKTTLLTAAATQEKMPGLNSAKLKGGVLYYDGQFDDSRLAIHLAQTAVNQGATVLNYCGVQSFMLEGDKIIGVVAKDEITEQQFEITAKVVINATGVFADDVLQMLAGAHIPTIAPSQGIHLVVDKRFFAGDTALMIPKTDDGRVLFAIPWYDKVLLGTTDTAVDKVMIEPRAMPEEIDFVIRHFNRYAISCIQQRDILSVFAGLRPLAKLNSEQRTAVMPRDHQVKVLSSGLVHVTGGKWTTYRSMSEDAINKAAATAGLPVRSCKTKNLPIHGAGGENATGHFRAYGADAKWILQLMQDQPELGVLLHPHYPYCLAEVQWMVEHEMALTVEDVLARRIRLLFLDAVAAMQAAPKVAKLMAVLLNKDESWVSGQLDAFNQLAKSYLPCNDFSKTKHA